MSAQIFRIHDYFLQRDLKKQATEILGAVIDYSEIARLGGPGGIDDLVIDWQAPYMAPDKDPA